MSAEPYSNAARQVGEPNTHPWDPESQTLDSDRFIASMARYMIEGDERDEARMLLGCTHVEAEEHWEQYQFSESEHILKLTFFAPRRLYDLLRDNSTNAYSIFSRAAEAALPRGFDSAWISTRCAIVAPNSANWRSELLAILDGTDVDNQAIGFRATQTWQGLRFRSQSEVRIAQELDRKGVMFFPNCRARLGSLQRRRNSEADFAVMLGGVWGVLEVDGPHHDGRASADHERDRPFHHHGAAIVQRYDSLRCFTDPEGVVLEFLTLLKAKTHR